MGLVGFLFFVPRLVCIYYTGQCLKKVGVVTESSLDSDESERFHSFKLEGELNKVPPQWYYQYTYHPVKTVGFIIYFLKKTCLFLHFAFVFCQPLSFNNQLAF